MNWVAIQQTVLCAMLIVPLGSAAAEDLAPGVRGVATRAPSDMVVDGDLSEFKNAFCYSDGAERVDRYFAYGSPLSVQQPASLAEVQLVEQLEPAHWKACGPVMMPIRCDTAWGQPVRARAYGKLTLPPNHLEAVGKTVFRLTDLAGNSLGEFEAERGLLQPDGNFALATRVEQAQFEARFKPIWRPIPGRSASRSNRGRSSRGQVSRAKKLTFRR